RGDFLIRFPKLFERVESAHHHVAYDQQRPAIPQRLERDAHRAAGTLLRLELPSLHGRTLSNIACTMQVIFTLRDSTERDGYRFFWEGNAETKKARPDIHRDGLFAEENYRLLLGAEVIDDSDRKALGILRRAV